MFEEINGLPVHPLMVHAAVIFAPLLVLTSVVFVLVPRWQARLAWLVAALAVVAPVSVLFAVLSGNAFRQRLIDRNLVSDQILDQLSEHQDYGQRLLLATIPLGLLMLVLAYVYGRRPVTVPGWARVGIGVVTVLLGAACMVFAVQAGDSGANMVWSGY